VLCGVPLLGLARFDLWTGRHLMARHPVGPVYGIGAVLMGILSFYVVTFVVNAFLGRVFCGFGCPVGQASRLGDDVEAAGESGKGRRAAEVRAIAFAVTLAAALALWLVSPRVLVEGSARAIAGTLGVVAALSGAIYLHGRFFRWRFCEAYCPIGIYYSAVQTSHGFGVHFDAAKHTCTACGGCQLVCPVGLDPRDLTRPKNDLGGLAIDGFPQANHCLTCGECVRACEHRFRRQGRALVPLRLSTHASPSPSAGMPAESARPTWRPELPGCVRQQADEAVVPGDEAVPAHPADAGSVVVGDTPTA
jgi:polyferredoxin